MSEMRRGLISVFSSHPTAANLLMLVMIILGVFSLSRMNTQFMPTFGIDWVRIAVEWPGASTDDVDANIVQSLEPELRYLDGVKKVVSVSIEGLARISIEFDPGSDMQAALADVQIAINQVTTLPEDSEMPRVNRAVRYDNIIRLLISGPYSETALKTHAKRIRQDLLARGIDKVDLIGARDEEIWVEVEPVTLRRLNLTLDDIARSIAGASLDLPLGDTQGGPERQIRSLGMMRTAASLKDVEVRALANGEKLYLRDIAVVSERFEDGGVTLRRNGERAIELFVQRSLSADVLEVADKVEAYLEEIRPTLPANLTIEAYDVAADLIRGRIDLLLRNGVGGLFLVVAILFIFLNARVAFWVAAGIPISLLATMGVMLASGQTINMVSLFGLIMAIGIVVDDAIVVGEHVATRYREGLSGPDAAAAGARRMAVPVLASSLTTIAAFTPLLVISDVIGQIIQAIPLVVIAVILASLIECFLVLPGHLGHSLSRARGEPSRWRRLFRRGFDHFKIHWFRPAVSFCVTWRYATLAGALGALILSFGMVIGGRVGFDFFPSPEADKLYANVTMVAGVPRQQTDIMLDEVERALGVAEEKLNGGERGLVKLSVSVTGTSTGRHDTSKINGDNIGGMVVELVPTDERSFTSAEFIEAWRAEVRPMAGLETVTIVPQTGGPPGREIDIRLSGENPAALKAAAIEIKALLASYPAVSDIEDSLPYGKQETILAVNTRGKALGFDTATVGRQLRNAFEGAIAKRFPRGDEEVVVRVQYPRGAIDVAALNELYLRGPQGAEVPLDAVVDRRHARGFAVINREDGVRQLAILAEVEQSIMTSNEVLAALMRDGLEEIAERHGVAVNFAGKRQEQEQTFGDMFTGALIGLVMIYIILAWVFGSYTRPLVVMSVIPMGFVGATLGHWLMGFDLTILSMVALIGLSGIVINDSIILVTTIDERLGRGDPPVEAIIAGAQDRLRAVILTSATTIGGLTPLIFETSLQAQFLIPMAITIVFGLMVSTILVLIVVPALIAIQSDFRQVFDQARAVSLARSVK